LSCRYICPPRSPGSVMDEDELAKVLGRFLHVCPGLDKVGRSKVVRQCCAHAWGAAWPPATLLVSCCKPLEPHSAISGCSPPGLYLGIHIWSPPLQLNAGPDLSSGCRAPSVSCWASLMPSTSRYTLHCLGEDTPRIVDPSSTAPLSISCQEAGSACSKAHKLSSPCMSGSLLACAPACPAQVLDAYTESFDFRDLKFDAAIRLFLESFRLPGGWVVCPRVSVLTQQCWRPHQIWN
jgi:hypothetical protein